MGHEVSVVYAKGEEGLVDHAIRLPELSRGDRASERAAQIRMQAILREQQPDVLHLHQVYNTGAIDACLAHGPVVVHAHDYRYVCPASTFYYKRSREVCQRKAGPACFAVTPIKHCLTPRPGYAFDYYRRTRWFARQGRRIGAILTPSAAAAARFETAGFASKQIEVLPYFCTFTPGDAPRALPENPVVLFVGRARANKGPDVFVEAFSHLSSEARAVMIGDFEGEGRRAVEQQARDLGCLDRIELKHWAGRDEIRAEFEAASVFVFPSIWPETLGIVGLEALACGVPVVASDIGGVREWLIDESTGFLAEPKNAVDFAGKIARLLEDSDLNLRMGRNGQQLIRDRFTPEYHLRRLLRLYGRVINARTRPGRRRAIH